MRLPATSDPAFNPLQEAIRRDDGAKVAKCLGVKRQGGFKRLPGEQFLIVVDDNDL